jgi:hypothetical protein
MPVITGGRVIEPQTTNPGLKNRIYKTSGAPSDALITGIGLTPANGMLAEDIVTGNVSERAAGVWTRIDTV